MIEIYGTVKQGCACFASIDAVMPLEILSVSTIKELFAGYCFGDLDLRIQPESLVVRQQDKRFYITRPAGSLPLLALAVSRSRRKAGLTQRQLAAQLGLKTHRSIVSLEKAQKMPTLPQLEKIATAIGLRITLWS